MPIESKKSWSDILRRISKEHYSILDLILISGTWQRQ